MIFLLTNDIKIIYFGIKINISYIEHILKSIMYEKSIIGFWICSIYIQIRGYSPSFNIFSGRFFLHAEKIK